MHDMCADNDMGMYNRQRKAGVDAIIMDDVAKLTKVLQLKTIDTSFPSCRARWRAPALAVVQAAADEPCQMHGNQSTTSIPSLQASIMDAISCSLCVCHLPLLQASGKQASFFNKPLRSPNSFADVEVVEALTGGLAPLAIGSPPPDFLDKA